MFRQILIDPKEADFQCILWRPTSESPLQQYRLLTVTYGLVRALSRRARSETARLFVSCRSSDYRKFDLDDDTLFGNDDITELREIRDQLIALTKRGGFQLRKWAANSQTLLDDIPNSYHELTNHVLSNDETLKVLYFGRRAMMPLTS